MRRRDAAMLRLRRAKQTLTALSLLCAGAVGTAAARSFPGHTHHATTVTHSGGEVAGSAGSRAVRHAGRSASHVERHAGAQHHARARHTGARHLTTTHTSATATSTAPAATQQATAPATTPQTTTAAPAPPATTPAPAPSASAGVVSGGS